MARRSSSSPAGGGLAIGVLAQRVGELVLVHLRAPLDAGRAGVLEQLGLGLVGVDAAMGLARVVAGRLAAAGRLRVGRAGLVLELPVVALLLGDVLDRRPGRAVGAFLAVVSLLGAVQRLRVRLLDLLRRALERAGEVSFLE